MSERREASAPKNAGHRSRLRERFLQGGLGAFLDYEIIELLLTLGTPRSDCKSVAKEALKIFGSLRAILDAPVEKLQEIKGIGPANVFGLKLFQAVSERLAREHVAHKVGLESTPLIVEYLQKSIGHEQRECFVALYLDAGSHLIKDKILTTGVLDMSLVQPREVFEPAIALKAASVIVAHNHPSGKVDPSIEDRNVTKQLVDTGRIVGIEVVDHLIVSSQAYFSFRQELLI